MCPRLLEMSGGWGIVTCPRLLGKPGAWEIAK